MEAGFTPYIIGGAWLKLKFPSFDILVHDFDIYCPDFDPERSPFEVERVEGLVESYEVPNQPLGIIKRLEHGTKIDENDLERWNGLFMVKNSFWLAAVLNKVANYISKPAYDRDNRYAAFSVMIPLVNCYIFYFAGFKFDPKRVARILRNDRFTNSRIAHLYNSDLGYASAVLASKYYLYPRKPDEILTDFCNKAIKPVSIEMGIYDAKSCGLSMEDNKR